MGIANRFIYMRQTFEGETFAVFRNVLHHKEAATAKESFPFNFIRTAKAQILLIHRRLGISSLKVAATAKVFPFEYYGVYGMSLSSISENKYEFTV